jgi:arginine exporter protein ArgO
MQYVNKLIINLIILVALVITGGVLFNHVNPYLGILVWGGAFYFCVYRFVNFVTNLENKESK